MSSGEVEITQGDIGWAESAAQHLCAPADRDAAIRLLSDTFRRHRLSAKAEAEREIVALREALEDIANARGNGAASDIEAWISLTDAMRSVAKSALNQESERGANPSEVG